MNRRRRIALLACSLWAFSALGQTSASWVADGDGSWSIGTNWSTLSTFPNSGGIATFATPPGAADYVVVTCDLSNVTLSSIVLDSERPFFVNAPSAGSPNTITLSGPSIVSVLQSTPGSPSLIPNGHAINVTLAGSNGITKIGAGIVNLGGSNAYSGGTSITAGVLGTTSGDAAFGAGSVLLSGGTIRSSIATMTSTRDFVVTGTGTIDAQSPFGTSGIISGSGALHKMGGNLLVLSGVNSYTGATQVHAGTLVLAGNGSILNSPSVQGEASITLDNATTNVNDRIGDLAPVTLRGSGFSIGGNAAAPTNEIIGTMNFDGGMTFVTAAPSAGTNTAVTSSALMRQNRGTVFYRGNSLGAAPGANVGNILYTTPPTLVGGGGSTNSSNISIIPFAWGNTSSTGNSNSVNSGFVTYGANGIRPLNTASEYVTSVNSGVSTSNARLSSTITLNGASTINALLCTTGGNLAGSGTLTVTSGMILTLNSPSSIANPLDFGGAEAILATAGLTTYGGKISGSGGLTKTGLGGATFSNSTSDYTGQTSIVCGNIILMGDVIAGAPGPLGNASSAIVLAPGSNFSGTARLWSGATGTVTINRALLATGNPSGTPGLGTSGSLPNQQLVMNGTITIETNLQLQNGPLTNGPAMILNGKITGSGRLSDNFASAQVINGDNDFAGGTEIHDGSYALGSNTALGTGTIWFVGNGAISASAGARTIANPLVILSSPTFNGSNNLTLTGPMNLGGFTVQHNISNAATTTYAGVLSSGGLIKAGPGTLILGATNTYAGPTTVSAGALVFAASQDVSTLTVNTGAVAVDSSGANKVLTARSLDIQGTGRLDLTDNDLIVDYSGATPIASIQSLLTTGYASGNWTGNGITSSSAASAPASLRTALGFAEATDLFSAFPATFVGKTIDATSILVRYTVAGDANLDGTVSSSDFNLLATNFGAISGKRWSKADFTFDGAVNSSDFNVLASGFGKTVPGGPGALVPEPSGVVIFGAILLVRSKKSGWRA